MLIETSSSKLEQLEQELKSIKQAVNPRSHSDEGSRPPRSPRASGYTTYTDSRPTVASQVGPSAQLVPAVHIQPTPASLSDNVLGSTSTSTDTAVRRPIKSVPTQSRTLGSSKVVSGADIDWYFDKFLECSHPFIPILRKRDPDECFDACPTLFWVVVYIACRRYARDSPSDQGSGGSSSSSSSDLFAVLTEALSRDIWTLLSTPIMSLEETHALLLMCAYPLPSIRFVTDPSTTFAGIAMNICMLLGLHTGRGAHPEFCVGSRQNVTCTDEEAASTWIMACILAQRSASSVGHPPPSIQQDDSAARRALTQHPTRWRDLLGMFDVQRFLNRMQTAMAAQVATAGGVAEGVVMAWEDEFEMVRPRLERHDSEITRFMMLSAQQEIQGYFFTQPSDQTPAIAATTSDNNGNISPSQPSINALRALRTAQRVITTTLALDSSPSTFLAHAPSWVFRTVIDAACLITSSQHSHIPPPSFPPLHSHSSSSSSNTNLTSPTQDGGDDPSLLVQHAHAAVIACSVKESDPPSRAAAILEAFWANRHRMPKSEALAKAWPHRLGAGITFWCLLRFNQGLKQAKISCKGIKGVGQPPRMSSLSLSLSWTSLTIS